MKIYSQTGSIQAHEKLKFWSPSIKLYQEWRQQWNSYRCWHTNIHKGEYSPQQSNFVGCGQVSSCPQGSMGTQSGATPLSSQMGWTPISQLAQRSSPEEAK